MKHLDPKRIRDITAKMVAYILCEGARNPISPTTKVVNPWTATEGAATAQQTISQPAAKLGTLKNKAPFLTSKKSTRRN